MKHNFPDKSSSEEGFFFDGSPSSWIKLFDANSIAASKGVLLFLGGEKELDRITAGWRIVVPLFANETGDRFFKTVEQILPENIRDRDVLSNLKQFLVTDLRNANFQDEEITSFLEDFSFIRLSSLEGIDLIAKLKEVQDGAAVAISCADLYRFAEINVQYLASTKSWVGIEFGFRTREQIHFAHLMELTRQTLKVAKQKDLFVTLFCEVHDFVQYEYPSDLLNDLDLSIISAPPPTHDHYSLNTFASWLSEIEIRDIDTILIEVSNTVKDAKNQALLTSYLLSAKQNFNAAWDVIEEHLEEFQNSGTGEILLSLSQAAISAGKVDQSKLLLQKSLDRGVNSLEDIHSAYKLAKALGLDHLSDQLLEDIQKKYPNNRLVLSARYHELFQSRQFLKAAEVANKLGDPFLVKLCETLSNTQSDLTDFFYYAKNEGKLDDAYLATAYEAEYRKEYRIARELASMIEADSNLISQALQIRIRAISKLLRDRDVTLENETAELMEVMRIASVLPQDADIRFEIEDLLESGIEEPAIIVMLSYILLSGIQSSFEHILTNDFSFGKYDVMFESPKDGAEEVTDFFEQYVKTMSDTKFFAIGQGEIPAHLRHFITPGLVRDLILILQRVSSQITRDDFHLLYQLLHIIVLTCREIGDPSSDFIATRVAVSSLALAGYAQQARDLAETSLLLFPRTQPEHFEWRIGQAWACYADAHHRTRNLLAALRCLCLSFLSWNGPALNRDLLSSFYRLAARIFRDLGLADFALETVNLERTISINTNTDERFIRQLDQVELSIRMTELGPESPNELLLEYLYKATELLDKSTEKELAPLMSLQAHLIMFLKLNEVEIPKNIEEDFKVRLGLLNEEQRNIMSAVITTQPEKEDLLRAVQDLAPANNLSDLAYQITQITNLIKNSIKTAYEKGDIDLFLLSSILASQPILTLHSNTPKIDRLLPSSSNIQGWWLQFLTENSQDIGKIIDGRQVVQNVSPAEEKTIAQLSKVSFQDFQTVIEPNEVVIVVARDILGNLYRTILSNDNHIGPEKMDNQVWSPAKHQIWRQNYPRTYGMWSPPTPFIDEHPSVDMVTESLLSLSIGDFVPKKSLFIIPDAELFGFPFGISFSNNGKIGESIEIAVVPSVSWLINTRRNSQRIYSGKRAWMGSSTSMDWTIHFLRDRLSSSLREADIELVENEYPRDLANSEFAFIVSHGGVGLFDNFRAISDATTSYSAEEFSRTLMGCGCVVLFVCNSGRSDPQLGSSETVGLVSELLKANVRCVVAPPWPLHVNVAEIWLPPFLKYLSSGYSVGNSVYIASREVAKKYDNPCAWGALQVYGDAGFKVDSFHNQKPRDASNKPV